MGGKLIDPKIPNRGLPTESKISQRLMVGRGNVLSVRTKY